MAVSVGKDLRLKQHMCSNTLPRPWPGICPCSLSCQASLCCLALEFSAAFSRYFITLPRHGVRLSHLDLVWAGAMWWHLSVTLLSWDLVCLLLPRFWKGSASTLRLEGYLLPKEQGRVCTEALLQGCRELSFNSAGHWILEINFPMQPLARI